MKVVCVQNYDFQKDSQKEVTILPSLTDTSEYESLEQILQRCLRGDFSKGRIELFDGYDDSVSEEELANSIAPQDKETFDMVDKFEIDSKAKSAVKSLESLKKKNFQKSAVADEENSKEHEKNKPTQKDGAEQSPKEEA